MFLHTFPMIIGVKYQYILTIVYFLLISVIGEISTHIKSEGSLFWDTPKATKNTKNKRLNIIKNL